MIYYFGKEFKYNFYPLTTDELDYELLTNTNPSIYLFDSYPTESDAASGAGALQTKGSWVDTEDALGKSITFDAIAEPADLNTFSKKYYVAVNTELEVGNPLPPVIKEIVVQRLRAQESIIEVEVAEVLDVEPSLYEKFKCCETIERYINTAIKEVKLAMSGCNLQFGDIQDPAMLNYAVVQLAISKAFFGLSISPGDKYYADGIRYKEEYEKQLKQVFLAVDRDRDGKPEGGRKASSGMRSLRILR